MLRTLTAVTLLVSALLLGGTVLAKTFDFRDFQPVAFGMLITSVEGDNKRVTYLAERRDLSMAKFLVHTDRTETFIYCLGKITDLPKTDHFIAIEGKSQEYVVELKDGRLSTCWLSKEHLF